MGRIIRLQVRLNKNTLRTDGQADFQSELEK